jgi:sterol desaturase/sphingolipid hydroxylase (fatty acid hydroxylase superfamily)
MLDKAVEFCTTFVVGLVFPIHDVLFKGSLRFYWLYIATGLAIAWLLARREETAPSVQQLFARETWLGESARVDYMLLFIGRALFGAIAVTLLFNAETVADWTSGQLKSVGVSGTFSSHALVLAAFLTLTLFVVDDFMAWVAHWVFHRIPALWEFHKVHHSAEHLNFATSERHHPVEMVLSAILRTAALGLVNGVFIALAGGALTPATIAGANVLLVAFNVAGGVLRHSPVWFSFGARVERWLISPAMHQIHHSEDPRHFDKNFGGSLAIWDRMFGTLYVTHGYEKLTYGIGAESKEFRTLSGNLVTPFAKAARVIRGQIAAAPQPTNPIEAADQRA